MKFLDSNETNGWEYFDRTISSLGVFFDGENSVFPKYSLYTKAAFRSTNTVPVGWYRSSSLFPTVFLNSAMG